MTSSFTLLHIHTHLAMYKQIQSCRIIGMSWCVLKFCQVWVWVTLVQDWLCYSLQHLHRNKDVQCYLSGGVTAVCRAVSLLEKCTVMLNVSMCVCVCAFVFMNVCVCVCVVSEAVRMRVDPVYAALRYGTSLAQMSRSSFGSLSESPTRSLVWHHHRVVEDSWTSVVQRWSNGPRAIAEIRSTAPPPPSLLSCHILVWR